MSLVPVVGDKAQITTAVPVATDNYVNGVLTNAANTLARAALSGGAQILNGWLVSNSGQIIYLDATAGLPPNTNFAGGVPLAPGGELCVSTGVTASYNNGLPFVANGALSVTITL